MSKNQEHLEAARRLVKYLAGEGIRLPHLKSLEALAAVHNAPNWNVLQSTRLADDSSELGRSRHALRKVSELLEALTATGSLDHAYDTGDVHPDEINRTCDLVDDVLGEANKKAEIAFDFLPQYHMVRKLLDVTVGLLHRYVPSDTVEHDGIVSVLRGFEDTTVWGSWDLRSLENMSEWVREERDITEEKSRTAYKLALYDFVEAHEPNESDTSMLDACLTRRLDAV